MSENKFGMARVTSQGSSGPIWASLNDRAGASKAGANSYVAFYGFFLTSLVTRGFLYKHRLAEPVQIEGRDK